MRESTQSWRELLVYIKECGLEIAPDLAVGDGALPPPSRSTRKGGCDPGWVPTAGAHASSVKAFSGCHARPILMGYQDWVGPSSRQRPKYECGERFA